MAKQAGIGGKASGLSEAAMVSSMRKARMTTALPLVLSLDSSVRFPDIGRPRLFEARLE